MFITDHFAAILVATGIVTALPLLQFFFPAQVLKQFNKLEIHDEVGLFYARHWGLLAFCIGGLLVYAASHPEARRAIMAFAVVEKIGMIALAVMQRHRPYAKGLRAAAVFDSACALLYAAYLGGLA